MKSRVSQSISQEKLITPIVSVNEIKNNNDEQALFVYLNNAYQHSVKQSNLQSLEKKYQKLTGKPCVILFPSVQEVYEKQILPKKIFDYLGEVYEKNLLKLTKQNNESINTQKPKNLFVKMKNFFKPRRTIDTDKTHEQPFLSYTK